MCEPVAAPSVEPYPLPPFPEEAAMSPSMFRSALAAAVAAGLVSAPSALARGAVFGGAMTDAQAIVLRTDAKAKKLKSAVIAWAADCKSEGYWAGGGDLPAAPAEKGFAPDPRELTLTRNKDGRFSGVQGYAASAGDSTALVTVQVAGRIKGKTARGTLHANVAIIDAGGNTQDGCDTGTQRWSATRAPGRVFGGVTSQQLPVVLRLDRSGRRVSDLMTGWGAQCQPDGGIQVPEQLSGFPIKDHRFGDAWSRDFSLDDGSKRTFAYSVAGKLGRGKASGSLQVKVTQTDPAGAQTMSCDSGAVSWRALTG
jgi:hypothetical protein